ncbi:GNAT family N-acetyltransferase [Streptomyces sp. V3I7]|uniref:GNAT family N-acetyltransferase n=1 Tax=Streptomyces sp. V3I7 TaxID=3042278 RepID=UPI0027818055|nr:GNAT family N-acetyltransferase [Streptomyces sp. V3I7]MDQ0991665.1 putative acetyltransferase [Streptomyces sp. V3I7]
MSPSAADVDVRPVTEAEFIEWQRALNTGFLRERRLTREQLEVRRRQFVSGRLLGAFDGDRCVATLRSFDQELTAVGGATVPADAITNVSVTSTHRRRGLLTRMMSRDLAAARDRGDVVATLIAAEYPIYGRYGFGPATSLAEWTVDVPRAGLDPRWSGPECGGRVDLVEGEEVRDVGPKLHERVRRAQAGAISRDDLWWQMHTGVVRHDREWTEPFYAVYRAPSGEVEGLVAYTCDGTWRDKQPDHTAEVRSLIAATPAAERALWHHLCSIDWITKVKSDRRAPDDLLPHLLPNPRAAGITVRADWLWVRILDVVRALEARTYEGTGTLVLEVADRDGLTGGGRRRYRLEASPEGASCTPVTAEGADLTLDVGELAALWLGDEPATRLVALGRVREERAGAARVADALLYTSRRPWCPDVF